ncbi:MAG TPA: choice-of-anchor Q domain-containing protein, partial [Rudaea sp.]|nr:choice-of-anchor Q domain-containing protein [Rudaea sp.]
RMTGNNSSGADTSGDICRALGNALVLSIQRGLKAVVRYDTITGEGDCLILAINGDSTSSIAIQNTALLGKPDWVKANLHPQPQSCFFYWDKISASTWPASYAGNLVWQAKDNACPQGTGNICNVDPKLADASLSAFNSLPAPNSPLVNAAATSVGTLPTDSRSLPRPSNGGYDIGATQYQGLCEDTLFRSDFSSPSTGTCQ